MDFPRLPSIKWFAPCALALAIGSAHAYPDKPIRLIIGFPPGGGADAVARPVADEMAKHLGQPVIVENRPGAGTTIAAAAGATAAPDGYTLYMGSANLYGAMGVVYKDFKYDGDDYTPISLLTVSPLLLAVSNELGVKTVQELVALAKSKPGALNYASSGIGGAPHLAGLAFSNATNVQTVHIPYKGGAQALQGIVGGETQFTFATPPSVLPLSQAGRLRVIAASTEKRSPLFPDLPSVAESGVPGYDSTFWFGLFGPKGLPKPIVDKVHDAAKRALENPEIREKLAATGNAASPSASPEEFADFARRDGERSLKLTIDAGVTAN